MLEQNHSSNTPVLVNKWISILYRQFQVYFNQHLKSEGVSSSEFVFLLALYHEDGLSQDNLSCRLYVDKASTARAIKALEEKHFVTRRVDLIDKRIKRVFITETGSALREKIYTVLDAWNTLITEDMTPEVISELSHHLEEITIKIRKVNHLNKEKINEQS